MALHKLGAAADYAFGTAPTGTPSDVLERSSSKEFTRRNEAKDAQGDVRALIMRGMVETISETKYSTATTVPALTASGDTALVSVELMASNQDFVKTRSETKKYDFAASVLTP